jgi:hypothetical protein
MLISGLFFAFYKLLQFIKCHKLANAVEYTSLTCHSQQLLHVLCTGYRGKTLKKADINLTQKIKMPKLIIITGLVPQQFLKFSEKKILDKFSKMFFTKVYEKLTY